MKYFNPQDDCRVELSVCCEDEKTDTEWLNNLLKVAQLLK